MFCQKYLNLKIEQKIYRIDETIICLFDWKKFFCWLNTKVASRRKISDLWSTVEWFFFNRAPWADHLFASINLVLLMNSGKAKEKSACHFLPQHCVSIVFKIPHNNLTEKILYLRSRNYKFNERINWNIGEIIAVDFASCKSFCTMWFLMFNKRKRANV